MKKLIAILAVVLLMTGCSDARVKVTSSSTTLLTVGTEKITKGEVFSSFMNRYPSEAVMTMATKLILAKQVPVDAAIKAVADEKLAEAKEKWDDEFEDFLSAYGYETEQEYYDKELIVTAQTDALTAKYITDNYDTLIATYKPRKIRVIQTSTQEKAVAAIKEIKEGANFEATATKYSSTSYKGKEQIVTTESSLFAAALTFATGATVPTLSTAIEDTTNKVFYVVQVTVADPAKFKDEILTTLNSDATFQKKAMLSFFEAGEFTIYDKTVYDEFKSYYAEYLNQK